MLALIAILQIAKGKPSKLVFFPKKRKISLKENVSSFASIEFKLLQFHLKLFYRLPLNTLRLSSAILYYSQLSVVSTFHLTKNSKIFTKLSYIKLSESFETLFVNFIHSIFESNFEVFF